MTISLLFRALPSVERLAGDPALRDYPKTVRICAARFAIDAFRTLITEGKISVAPTIEAIAEQASKRAALLDRGRLQTVINATGVVIHTNLGRAPWSDGARDAAMRVAGYCDLEMDMDSGARGGRMRGVSTQLEALTGAESALVVNNCAAAVLLALTTLASGREVVVSRGELVEIGGSFRVPDVISSGGAVLVSVGTTNRTRIADFEQAIGPDTALLLRVHPSNFRTIGFCESPTRAEIAKLAAARGLFSIEDLGSGSLRGDLGEPSVREVIASGIDLVMFSGDKLLGGPQAGVIAGRAALIERLRSHPLYRALRVDKVVLAALEATLGDHLAGRPPPVQAMLDATLPDLQARAKRLADLLDASGVACSIIEAPSVAGGGALPERELRSVAVTVPVSRHLDAKAKALRTGRPVIVARLALEELLFDVRTVREEELDSLARRVAEVVRGQPRADAPEG